MGKVRKALPSVIYLIIAGLFYWQTFSIRKTDTMGLISATTVPRVILLLLVIAALINLIHDLRNENEPERFIQVPWKFLVTALLLLFAAQYCKKVGFVIVGSIFLGVMFNLLDDAEVRTPKRIILQVLLGIVLSFAICYAFRYGLKVRLSLWPKF